ncbi:MAG: UDP-2,3-diacylglucosamine diphosphatase LpxI [Pseudomonadota bacterium]
MNTPLGIVAGLGDLPVRVAEDTKASGRDVFVLRIAGFEEPALEPYPGDVVGIGELGRQIKLLKAAGCEELVFAGVVKRPDFSKIKLDMRGARLLPKVLKAARRGDDALLSLLVGVLEDEGFTVRGAESASSGLLVPAGLVAGPKPTADHLADLAKAHEIAGLIGTADIGQGCIVCDGLVLAVEAQEGTDAMLARCAALPEEIRGTPDARRGVLVKRPKPQQERRIDLPTAGVSTIEGAAAAGLAGIGLEADGALMVDKDRMIARAEALGLFIYGLDPDPSP